MATAPRKHLSDPLRKQIAFSQDWRCAGTCGQLLPPTFETDHIIARADGGTDDASNLQCLCPNCHAFKTAAWYIANYNAKQIISYDDRWDVYLNKTTLKCTLCNVVRSSSAPPHTVCFAIESPHAIDGNLRRSLAKYVFRPRGPPATSSSPQPRLQTLQQQ